MKAILILIFSILLLTGCGPMNQQLRDFSDEQVIIWQDGLETDKHLTENFYEIWHIVSPRIQGAIEGKLSKDDLDIMKRLDEIAGDRGILSDHQIGETKKLLYQLTQSIVLPPVIRKVAPGLLKYLGL